MNSIELTQELQRQFAQARQYLQEHGYTGSSAFHVSNTQFRVAAEPKIEFTISNCEYGLEQVEVRGRLLGDIVEEFLRRHHFTTQQATLALGPPQIDAETNTSEEEC